MRRPGADREARAPALSVLLTMGPLRERAERVLRLLAAEPRAGDLEVLIVDHASRAGRELEIPANLRTTRVPADGLTMYAGRVEATMLARAPIVALLEDHAYPRAGWADAVLEAHRGPWAAVGYAMANPEPFNWVSRAGLVTEYARTMHPAPPGPVSFLPAHNVSYRREVLVALGDRLERLFASDLEMAAELRARGLRMYLEPRAVVEHEFFRSIRDNATINLAHGRALAGSRCREWSLPRRLFWALGTPLSAPVVRAWRMWRALRRRRLSAWRVVVPALPVMTVCFAWEAIGEVIGFLAGPGDLHTVGYWELDVPRDRARGARDGPYPSG